MGLQKEQLLAQADATRRANKEAHEDKMGEKSRLDEEKLRRKTQGLEAEAGRLRSANDKKAARMQEYWAREKAKQEDMHAHMEQHAGK